jgi:hypothetical protein
VEALRFFFGRTVNWYLENQIWLNNITGNMGLITSGSGGGQSVFNDQLSIRSNFFLNDVNLILE